MQHLGKQEIRVTPHAVHSSSLSPFFPPLCRRWILTPLVLMTG